jgi:phosphoribosylformimino-5-aminoimidazole carboxamide ribotide isomerase
MPRLRAVLAALDNDKDKLVIDLSCRRKDDRWFVATNKWQTMTDFELNQGASSHQLHQVYMYCVLVRVLLKQTCL